MKSKRIQTNILYILLDCQRHTIADIAEKAETSYSTVQRHIAELSMYYPIVTISGGRDTGGVQMKQSIKLLQNFFSKEEIHLIIEGLILLSEQKGKDTSSVVAKFLATTDKGNELGQLSLGLPQLDKPKRA